MVYDWSFPMTTIWQIGTKSVRTKMWWRSYVLQFSQCVDLCSMIYIRLDWDPPPSSGYCMADYHPDKTDRTVDGYRISHLKPDAQFFLPCCFQPGNAWRMVWLLEEILTQFSVSWPLIGWSACHSRVLWLVNCTAAFHKILSFLSADFLCIHGSKEKCSHGKLKRTPSNKDASWLENVEIVHMFPFVGFVWLFINIYPTEVRV